MTEKIVNGKKWNRTSIQFTEEEYDRLARERYESRKPVAQIIRDALNFYFESKEHKRKAKKE